MCVVSSHLGSVQNRLFSTGSDAEESEEEDIPDNLIIDEECDLFEWEPSAPVPEAELLSGNFDPPTLPILKFEDPSQEVGEVQLLKSVWGQPIRADVVHRVVCWQRAGWRQGSSKTKSRGEVRGGGRKPWQQKGTGRARHGSIRSPIWRGGGHAHAKRPKDWSYKLNRKVRQMGLKSALSAKCKEGNVNVVDSAGIDVPKTAAVVDIISSHGWDEDGDAGVLFLIADSAVDETFALASRNIPTKEFEVITVDALLKDSNVYDIVLRKRIVLTAPAVTALHERLGGDIV